MSVCVRERRRVCVCDDPVVEVKPATKKNGRAKRGERERFLRTGLLIMSTNKVKKVKMATKSCPECDQQVRLTLLL